MTATNKCYNFVGFGYRASLTKDSRQAKVRANSGPNHINKGYKAS